MCDIKLFKSSKAKAKPVRGSRRFKVFIEIIGQTLILSKSDLHQWTNFHIGKRTDSELFFIR